MRKIALLMDGWQRYFTYAWPAGIMTRIRETDEDVNLYIFNSSGNWSRDEEYNEAEYNIFSLPNLADFDGIILDLNNILHAGIAEHVVERVKQVEVPVIAIGQEIEDYYYVGIDNRRAIREVMEHLAKVHGCRHFWFVMGPEDNYENQKRVEEIRQFLKEKGFAGSASDFYFEAFDYDCGMNGFSSLLRQHKTMPDAIVCANDNIAVGVCEAAKSYGYQIPQDFLVTGFDNFDKASYYKPDISTVSHIREDVGYTCADIFLRLWKGEKLERFHFTKTECIFGGSCGCIRQEKIDEREYLRQQMIYQIETQAFEEEVLSLEYDLIQCRNFGEMIACLTKCMPTMKCDALYLVVDNELNNYKERCGSLLAGEEEVFCIHGYPDKMKVEFAYRDGKSLELENSRIEGIFPMFDSKIGGRDYLFLPLHFRGRTIGYFVIRNAVYLMEKQYLHEIITTLTNAMENLHKKETLEYMNERLSELYVRDSMSGLYNRMGGMNLANQMFDRAKQKKESLVIMFVDLDRLKYINDNLGHEKGDFAIKAVSGALLRCYDTSAVVIRLGGDEFLVVMEEHQEAGIEKKLARLRADITAQGEAGGLPVPLSVSTGYVITDPNSDKDLGMYINEADDIMYREKTAKKASRTD